MRLSVHYSTTYTYAEPVRRVIQLLRVEPLSFAGQSVLDWRVDVDQDAKLREGRDGYGNVIHMLYVDSPVSSLTLSIFGRVLTEDKHGIVQGLPYDLPSEIFLRATPLTQPGPTIQALADASAGKGGTIERLHRLVGTIHRRLRFDTDATEVETRAEQAAAEGHGVCQDFAHIFIAAARLSDIPARYVSGHLFRRDGRHEQQAAHAWAEAWVDDLGWVAFDPVNGISTDDAYLRVACGLDYRDAAPIAGARSGGGDERLTVEVRVSDAAAGQSQSQAQS
ncbi:MAG TPA: transglutaminase family protein [Allosphingosinicella sp.]|nr:transglutaminase family protein [Allosphingosinicella sp.]